MKDYAMYKGDKLLFIGSKKEMAIFRKVQERTIEFYCSPTYKKRIAGKANRLDVIRLED